MLPLYPGLVVAVQRDLTEPLAYALVAVGAYLLRFGGRRKVFWAGAAFRLAGLARQTTLVFPAVYAIGLLLEGEGPEWRARVRANARSAIAFAALAAIPVIAYTGFLWVWLGPLRSNPAFTPIPFSGLFDVGGLRLARQPPDVIAVVLPSLIWVGLALGALRRRVATAESAILLLNVLLFVVLAHAALYSAYTNLGRNALGVVLAAILCIPAYRRLEGNARGWMWAASALWLSMLPIVAVYDFTNLKLGIA